MKSSDEEYLESLLNSAQQSNNNSQSALSRMSSRNASGSGNTSGSGDLGELVNNSNGNKDLNEIGAILNKLDRNELVDQKMADLLDDIEMPGKPGVPKFTIGNNPSSLDVRDPEEIALDEAIADAERLDAEIQSGKFNNASLSGDDQPADNEQMEDSIPQAAPASPLVDIEEGDDALLEMAPEVSLPEDNEIKIDEKQDSDANDSPEEIFTDMLDDMHDESLMSVADGSSQDSLSDVLDNMKEDEDNFSLDDIEKAMDMAIGESADSAEAPQEDISLESLTDDMSALEEMTEAASSEEISLDEASPEQPGGEEIPSLDGVMDVAPESAPEGGADGIDSLGDMNLEDLIPEGMSEEELMADSGEGEDSSAENAGADSAKASLEDISEDDLDLDALEASLDDLIGGEEGDAQATEGEVAAVDTSAEEPSAGKSEGGEGEDVSMQDLDALMNSLANDEIEDLENSSEGGAALGEDSEGAGPQEDLLGALTEDEFNMDPSLEELASIPERGSRSSGDDEDGSGKKKKKPKKEKGDKKEGFFAKLFKALTREDEESQTEGLASLTDENQKVLNELGEGDDKGKGKKKKKEKKPKEKKPKKEKPPKEKKPPKPKKEKKPKPPKDPGVPEKAISPKNVSLAFIFAVSLGVLICIPAFVLPDRIASQRAVTAYTHNEYTEAYKMLYGKTMNEEESLMYEQSRVLAWAQRYLDGYENYTAMNMKEEALDMLLMAMRNQSDLMEEANKYSVATDVESVYDSIVSLLSESYGLSETDILEINSIKKDRDYTIRLMEIVGTIES